MNKIPVGESRKTNMMHGGAPAAPTIMTYTDVIIRALPNSIKIDSNMGTFTIDREGFKFHEIPWTQQFGDKLYSTHWKYIKLVGGPDPTVYHKEF